MQLKKEPVSYLCGKMDLFLNNPNAQKDNTKLVSHRQHIK